MPTRHVVLVTYGEPPTAAFLDQLAYSWRILVGLTRTIAPIPKAALPLIALARARGRTRTWTEERYQSPLEPITLRQAEVLQTALDSGDPSSRWRVHVAYEFRHPLLRDVLAAIPPDEATAIVPMYAADSAFTHGLSRSVLSALRSAGRVRASRQVLAAIDAEVLGEIAAAHVRLCVGSRPGWSGPDVALVLAAHGTLIEPPRPIDTGLEATERLCRAIRTRLSHEFGLIVNGWLNHARGGRWTEPAVEEALRQVVNAGFTRAVYFPYGFLADNAESQLEGRVALRSQPRLEALHLPCPNDFPLLIHAIADAVASSDVRHAWAVGSERWPAGVPASDGFTVGS